MTLQGVDSGAAATMATALLDRLIDAQAAVESFSDAYALIGMLFLGMLPPAFMAARHPPGRHAPIE